jgi:hypothetical protein
MDDTESAAVLAELISREPLFHRTEWGTTRADFEAMTTPDFWEVGASGAIYNREFVWSVLEKRYAENAPDEWRASDFRIRPLSDNVFLLTYELHQGPRVTRRATVWDRGDGRWRIVYHQGTVVTPPSG